MRRTAYRKSQGLAKHVSQTIGSTKCLVDFGKKNEFWRSNFGKRGLDKNWLYETLGRLWKKKHLRSQTYTKHEPGFMDQPCGPGPWTTSVDPVHGPPLWTQSVNHLVDPVHGPLDGPPLIFINFIFFPKFSVSIKDELQTGGRVIKNTVLSLKKYGG